MEKIIAVVVMIAIVIGLIATAVLPMVNQMNEQGATANNQLTQMGQTVSNTNMRQGSAVRAEIQALATKFSLTSYNLTLVTVDNTKNSSGIGDAGNNTLNTATYNSTGVTTILSKINDSAMYLREDTLYNNGSLKELKYTLQNN